jgi:hypothetical protein
MTSAAGKTQRRTHLLRVIALGSVACTLAVGVATADPSSAYDQAVKDYRNVPITFGHDVDLEGAAWDFARKLVERVELPADSANKVKAALLNATDFWKDNQQSVAEGKGMSESALNLFVVKTVLDNLSPKEVVRVKQIFGLSNDATKAMTKYGVNLVEGKAQAEGEAAEGDTSALQTAALATIDTVCPECAIARKGVLLTYEAARAVEAWTQDEATKVQYGNWKAWAKGKETTEETFLTTAEFAPTMKAARTALEAIYAAQRRPPPSEDEVVKFIRHRFEGWKHAEDVQGEHADLLAKARDDYLGLSDAQRLAFGGRTDGERASSFGKAVVSVYESLIAQMGSRPFPPGGKDRLLSDAVRLATIRAQDGDSAYYGALLDNLRRYGWAIAVPADRKEAIKDRLVERLSHLSFANLRTFLDYADAHETTAFYGCLCTSTPGVGLVKRYDPKGGRPCFFGGLGEWWDDFPSDASVWQACLAQTMVAPNQSFADHLAERIIQWQGVQGAKGPSDNS